MSVWLSEGLSQLSHLGPTDELLQPCNLSPDLVLFADKVMDTLGQLLLVRGKKGSAAQKGSLVTVHQVTHASNMKSETKVQFIDGHSCF